MNYILNSSHIHNQTFIDSTTEYYFRVEMLFKTLIIMSVSMCVISKPTVSLSDVGSMVGQFIFGTPEQQAESNYMQAAMGQNPGYGYPGVAPGGYPGIQSYPGFQPQGYYPMGVANPQGQTYPQMPPTNFGQGRISDYIELLRLVQQSSGIREALQTVTK